MHKCALMVFLALTTLTACGASQQQIPTKPTVQTGGQTSAQTSVQTTGFSVAPADAPSGPVVDMFARNFLNSIQTQSINGRREYCGYFFVNPAGQLQATPPIAGSFATCDMPEPQRGKGIIASYHTHAAYDGAYDNEVPSAVDLQSDFDYGINGYVSTPGGRVWLVDYQTRTTRQICGVGCVVSDQNFIPDPDDVIRPSYSVRDLQVRRLGF